MANWYAATNQQFKADSRQHNVTTPTPLWPSVSESLPRVGLGITVFCVLALPQVTLGITAKEANDALAFLSDVDGLPER